MGTDSRIETWVASYKKLAMGILQDQVQEMHAAFPDEHFPMHPPYRKAMYKRLSEMVDNLNTKMNELLDESPDETDAALRQTLMSLQEGYEQDFIRQVRNEGGENTDPQYRTTMPAEKGAVLPTKK